MQSISMHDSDTASFALSPQHGLSPDQYALLTQIEGFVRERLARDEAGVFVIQGDAGTGKSVLMHHLFARLQSAARHAPEGDELHGRHNVLLVNHAEMIKAYHHAAEGDPDLRKQDYLRPTTFINRMHARGARADIALVDEAHLLLTRSDRYNRFEQVNQLAEILKLARVVVLVFDQGQVLKFKSLWRDGDLDALLAGRLCRRHVLQQQWRMRAHRPLLEWIAAVGEGHVPALPEPEPGFELRVFDDAAAMYACIRERDARCGRARMLATYDFPYRIDGEDHFVRSGTLELRWDRYRPQAKRPWAEQPETVDEVGSVYTVQGFDLNYVGLILGPSLGWDARAERITVNPGLHQDDGAFQGKAGAPDAQRVQQRIMLNAVGVLMTRAVHGLYLYAHDDALRQRLLALQSRSAADWPALPGTGSS